MNIFQRIRQYLRDSRYCVGFIVDYKCFNPVSYTDIHWLDVDGYREGWFADPFILEADNQTITVLAEEWYYPINHGRISKLKIDRKKFKLLDVKPILQLDTHLSFPYIVREAGVTYILPENYESGNVILYEYDFYNGCLTNPVTLVEKPLLDVQILKREGMYYLMGVEYKTGEQDDTRVLQIFTSQNLFGPYTYIQTIVSEQCDRRGAGQIFIDGRKIIRPTQCCENNEYGTAVIFMGLKIEPMSVSEQEIGRITRKKHRRNGLVLHTFNQFENVTAIDGWDYTHRYAGRFTESIRKTIRKIIH